MRTIATGKSAAEDFGSYKALIDHDIGLIKNHFHILVETIDGYKGIPANDKENKQ